jgi:glycogen operon protein
VKLIAEPWDLGPGGYQVGWFSPGWAEWNDRYRDTVRSYWKGDAGKVAELATRLSGSADFFNKRGRKPWASVNFVTVHDGFTLNDLVSYNEKHNEANGEDNKAGNSNNLSWNCGAEGPTVDATINEIRQRQMRNMLASILFSQGTPLLLAGDEFARTQQGNNNAYCQDNEISWVNWDKIGPEGKAQTTFVRKLTMLRNALPVLRRNRYLDATFDEKLGVKALTWINATGTEMDEGNWQDANLRCFGMLMDGRGQSSGIKRPADDVTLLMVMNSHSDMVQFTLPAFARGKWWIALVDTDEPDRAECPRLQSGTPRSRREIRAIRSGVWRSNYRAQPSRRPNGARVNVNYTFWTNAEEISWRWCCCWCAGVGTTTSDGTAKEALPSNHWQSTAESNATHAAAPSTSG